MTAAFVASATAAVNGTTVSVNVPTGTSNGHVMVMAIMHAQAAALGGTTMAGWTLVSEITDMAVYIRVASSEPASYSPSWVNSGNCVVIVDTFSGVDTADPVMAFQYGVTNTTVAAGFQTVNAQDYMGLTYASLGRTTSGVTYPSGYTTAGYSSSGGGVNNTVVQAAGAYKAFTATQDLAGVVWGFNNSAAVHTVNMALRPSGQAGQTQRGNFFNRTGSGTSLSVQPYYAKAGDIGVIAVAWRSSATHTPPSGWTTAYSLLTGVCKVAVLTKTLVGGDDWTVTLSSASNISAVGHSLVGVSDTPVCDSANTTGATTALTVAGLASLGDYPSDSLMFAHGALGRGDHSFSGPTGWHLYVNSDLGNSALMSYGWSATHDASGAPSATSFTLDVADTGTTLTYAFPPTTPITAISSLTDAVDTTAASGSVSSSGVTGTSSLTDAHDTTAATGALTFSGTSVLTDAHDTMAATGTSLLGVTGTSAVTDAHDTTAASGVETFTGTSALTDAVDQTTGVGTALLAVTGTSSLTDAADQTAALGTSLAPVVGTAVFTDAVDSLVAVGIESFVGDAVIVDASDSTNASGSVVEAITGASVLVDVHDVVAATGTSLVAVIGTAVLVDASDVVAAVGLSLVAVTGTSVLTDAVDAVAATGTEAFVGTAVLTDAADTFAAAGALLISGSAVLVDARDVSGAAGSLQIIATATFTDAVDSVATTGVVANPVTGSSALVDAVDRMSASGYWFVPRRGQIGSSDTASNLGTTMTTTSIAGSLTATQIGGDISGSHIGATDHADHISAEVD